MNVPPDFGVDNDVLTAATLPNSLRQLKQPEGEIMNALRRCRYDSDTIFAIKLAFEEAVTNAVKHGNCNDPDRHVHLRWYVDEQRVVIAVRDEGAGFKVERVPDPTRDENLERPNGRGIMLMQSYMTKVRFNSRGNEVWLLKLNPRRSGTRPSA